MDESRDFRSIPHVGRLRTLAIGIVSSVALALAIGVTRHAAAAADQNDIVIVNVDGEVRLTNHGEKLSADKNKVIQTPVSIETGPAGNIELRQGQTRIAVAGDSRLAIPADSRNGRPIERIIQEKGSSYYDVEKRNKKKLRVETPFLVSVIKGTKFNITVDERSATIALFEGRLEVMSDLDSVELLPGEVATRSSTDTEITVLSSRRIAPRTRPLDLDDRQGRDSRRARLADDDLAELVTDLDNDGVMAESDDSLDDTGDDLDVPGDDDFDPPGDDDFGDSGDDDLGDPGGDDFGDSGDDDLGDPGDDDFEDSGDDDLGDPGDDDLEDSGDNDFDDSGEDDFDDSGSDDFDDSGEDDFDDSGDDRVDDSGDDSDDG